MYIEDFSKVNEIQFLHKVGLKDMAKSILTLCDKHSISESDILILSSFFYLIKDRNSSDQLSMLATYSANAKKKLKEIEPDLMIHEIKRLFSRVFYKKFIFSSGDITERGLKFNYEFFFKEVKVDFAELPEETFIKEFIECIEQADYTNAVRLYFSALLLNKKNIVDKFSRIQRDKCKANFIYELNQEVIFIGTLLIKYGKSKSVDVISEEVMEICSEAIEEIKDQLIQERITHSNVLQEYEAQIIELETELDKLRKETTEVKMMLSAIKEQKILDGLSVLVIGDDAHKVGYKEVIEKHGGVFNFLNGIEIKGSTARKKAMTVDIIFLITAYCQHEVSDNIIDLPNMYYVNSAGIESLEREVLRLRKVWGEGCFQGESYA